MTLAVEEPAITTVSIRPGVVDTEMQREIREVHAAEDREEGKGMTPEDAAKFVGLHKAGKLLKPEQPGHVMAKLIIDAPTDLSGKFLRYVLFIYFCGKLANSKQLGQRRAFFFPIKVKS